MGKPRTEKNWDEAWDIVHKFYGNQQMLTNAIVQLIEREKVRVLNKYLAEHNEPLIPPEPPMLRGGRRFEWLIDVPKEWISMVSKFGKS